jgi:hypothetical protein
VLSLQSRSCAFIDFPRFFPYLGMVSVVSENVALHQQSNLVPKYPWRSFKELSSRHLPALTVRAAVMSSCLFFGVAKYTIYASSRLTKPTTLLNCSPQRSHVMSDTSSPKFHEDRDNFAEAIWASD